MLKLVFTKMAQAQLPAEPYLEPSRTSAMEFFWENIWRLFGDIRQGSNKLLTLRKKGPYSEFFESTFSRIRTEYGDLLGKSPYSVRMWKNRDKKNSEQGFFLRSVACLITTVTCLFYNRGVFNPLSTNPTKSSNILKQFVGILSTIDCAWPFCGIGA